MHACTQLFKEEFAGIASALNNCKSKPAAMTTTKAVAAGRAVLNQPNQTRRKAEEGLQVHELTFLDILCMCMTLCIHMCVYVRTCMKLCVCVYLAIVYTCVCVCVCVYI